MKPIKRIGQPKIDNSNFEQELENIIENIDKKNKFELDFAVFSKIFYMLDSIKTKLNEESILFLKNYLGRLLTCSSNLKECEVDLDNENYNFELDLSILKFMLVKQDIVTTDQIDTLIDSYKMMNKITE